MYVTITRDILTPNDYMLFNLIRKNADYEIDLYQNPSGFSKDISGQVRYLINLDDVNEIFDS